MPSSKAISARNAISMAPMLSAMCRPSPVPRAIAPRRFSSFFFVLVFGHHDAACGLGLLGFGHEHFRNENRPGSRHNDGAQHVPRFGAEGEVGRHDRARNVCHAAGHDCHQLRVGQVGQERADGHRRFGLAHENAGGDVERLGAADAHDPRHQPRRRRG